jgi:hypothetical protein
MYYLYNKTLEIDNEIIKKGYNLVTIWEHDFNTNKEMTNMSLSEYDLVEPPKIRIVFTVEEQNQLNYYIILKKKVKKVNILIFVVYIPL